MGSGAYPKHPGPVSRSNDNVVTDFMPTFTGSGSDTRSLRCVSGHGECSKGHGGKRKSAWGRRRGLVGHTMYRTHSHQSVPKVIAIAGCYIRLCIPHEAANSKQYVRIPA